MIAGLLYWIVIGILRLTALNDASPLSSFFFTIKLKEAYRIFVFHVFILL